MTTGIDWGADESKTIWQVRCQCGAVVADGEGPPPSLTDVGQMAEGHRHLQEATTGVHRLQVVQRGQVREKG